MLQSQHQKAPKEFKPPQRLIKKAFPKFGASLIQRTGLS